MTIEFARLQDAIPLVRNTDERGVKFPSPSDGQRVQNLETGAIERYSPGMGWVTDILSGGPGGGLTVGQADQLYYRKTDADIRYLTATTAAAAYAPIVHGHDDLYYGKAFSDARYAAIAHNHDATYSPLGHNHDTRYYTQAQSDARYEPLGGGGAGATPFASATTSGKLKTDVTEADPVVYTKASVDGLLAGKSAIGHAHNATTDITSGTVNVNRLGSSGTRDATTFLRGDNTWTAPTAVVPLATTITSGTVKTDVSHADPIVYTKVSTDTLLGGKANAAHTHAGTDIVSGLVAVARLGSGTPDSTKFLRGDGSWALPPSAGGVPLDLTGSLAGPMATWTNTSATGSGLKFTGPSSMFDGTYSYMATDPTNTYRHFMVFGAQAQLQLGRTPAATKWFNPGVTAYAPAGSNGPVKGFDPGVGLMLFGTPGIGDANIWFVNNGNNSSNLTMSLIRSSGDGGVRFEGNRYSAPERAGIGTVTRTALDTATFSSSASLDDLEIGDSIWVDVGGTIYGYTIRGKPTSTTARLYDGDPGGAWSARAFTIRSSPSANRSKMSSRFGWDSGFNRFMFSTYQAPNTVYAADDWAMVKDGQLVIYPGGWDVPAAGAFTSTTSIGLTGRGRRLEFFTCATDSNDSFKTALIINPWYNGFPSGGTVAVKGTLSAEGGSGGGAYGDRAPINVIPMKDWHDIDAGVPAGRPAIWNNGDLYITATIAASPNKLRYIAGGNIYEVNATLIGPA